MIGVPRLQLPLQAVLSATALGLVLASSAIALPARADEPAPYPLQVTAPAPSAPTAPSTPVQETPAPEPSVLPSNPPAARPHVDPPPLISKNAPPALVWKWPHFGVGNFFVAGAGAALTLTGAIVKPRAKHSLGGGILFDDAVRDALRVKKLANRYLFRDATDVGLSLTVTWPFAADALTTAWWYRGSRETAEEMALIDLETLAVTGALQGVTNTLVSRERPFGPGCGEGELPSDALDCRNNFHYRSFFSGHSAFSFTGAALICVHHMENELLGPPWDALSCAGGYAVAATTTTFRVVADVHYASDVLLGAAVGTLVGYSVPLLHYRHMRGSSGRASVTQPNQLQLHLIPSPGGIGLLGIF